MVTLRIYRMSQKRRQLERPLRASDAARRSQEVEKCLHVSAHSAETSRTVIPGRTAWDAAICCGGIKL
jgi:hypothetical protein